MGNAISIGGWGLLAFVLATAMVPVVRSAVSRVRGLWAFAHEVIWPDGTREIVDPGSSHPMVPSVAIGFGALAFSIVVLTSQGAGGGFVANPPAPPSGSPPAAPTVDAASLADSAFYAFTGAYSGEGSLDSVQFRADTIDGDWTGALYVVQTVAAPQLRDSIYYPLADVDADAVMKAAARHKDEYGWSDWSDSVEVTTGVLIVFQDGFESGDISSPSVGTWYDRRFADVSDIEARTGTYSLRAEYVTNQANNKIVALFDPPVRSVWAEWYEYIPNDGSYEHPAGSNYSKQYHICTVNLTPNPSGALDNCHNSWGARGGWVYRLETSAGSNGCVENPNWMVWGAFPTRTGSAAWPPMNTFDYGCWVDTTEVNSSEWIQYRVHLKTNDFAWPDSSGHVAGCKNGVHQFRVEGLPFAMEDSVGHAGAMEFYGNWNAVNNAPDTVFKFLDDVTIYGSDPGWTCLEPS